MTLHASPVVSVDNGTPAGAPVAALIVDDDDGIHELVATALAPHVRVRAARTIAEGLAGWRAAQPDILLIDLNLADGSGIEMIVEVRKSSSVPIIVVTGDATSESCVLALRLGADDYLTKPFNLLELEARIDAVVRRSVRSGDRPSVRSFGDLTIDVEAREVRVNGEDIHLTATEFDLLSHLSSQPRHAFTREQLLDTVWSSNPEWQTLATVTEHTRRLRSKLGPAAQHIVTVYGRGYRFDP